jgi:septum formation protein
MIHTLLKDKQVILASASPRRKDIFMMLGIKAVQMPADMAEEMFSDSPAKIVKTHSRDKATAVAENVDRNCVVVASDTVVFEGGKILGKPKDKKQAYEFLTRLSGKFHFVYSGVSIKYKHHHITEYTKTKVFFRKLSDSEIQEYLQTNEPFDKAGAYGIQGYGSQFIKKISGCYFNVMGFPVSLFYDMLDKIIEN